MYKTVYRVFCSDEIGVNKWLKNNPDADVVEIKMSANEEGEVVMVVYKIELEEK